MNLDRAHHRLLAAGLLAVAATLFATLTRPSFGAPQVDTAILLGVVTKRAPTDVWAIPVPHIAGVVAGPGTHPTLATIGGLVVPVGLVFAAGLVVVRGWARDRRRMGRCIACGHPWGEAARCQECGARADAD